MEIHNRAGRKVIRKCEQSMSKVRMRTTFDTRSQTNVVHTTKSLTSNRYVGNNDAQIPNIARPREMPLRVAPRQDLHENTPCEAEPHDALAAAQAQIAVAEDTANRTDGDMLHDSMSDSDIYEGKETGAQRLWKPFQCSSVTRSLDLESICILTPVAAPSPLSQRADQPIDAQDLTMAEK